MAIVEVKVPQLSESVAEATMLQWKKKVGDAIAIDEILIEIETDKVVLEVPAPSATVNSVITPADGAGTSSTTLSVSISIRISSTATESPTFFFHCSMVASATDSDNWGTLTSTIAMLILFNVFVMLGWVVQRLLRQHKALEFGKRAINQRFLLLLVQMRISDCRRG